MVPLYVLGVNLVVHVLAGLHMATTLKIRAISKSEVSVGLRLVQEVHVGAVFLVELARGSESVRALLKNTQWL